MLDECFPGVWKYNGDFRQEISVGGRIPDFIHRDQDKVIELFGRPFHTLTSYVDRVPWEKTNEGTLKHYTNHGYLCLVIWDTELSMDNVRTKVSSFLQGT